MRFSAFVSFFMQDGMEESSFSTILLKQQGSERIDYNMLRDDAGSEPDGAENVKIIQQIVNMAGC